MTVPQMGLDEARRQHPSGDTSPERVAIRRDGGEEIEMSDTAGDELLALAVVEHERAAAIASAAVMRGVDPIELSYAHQALGIVLRDRGDIDLALKHLGTARRLAVRADDADRLADVRATLGGT